MKRVIKLLTLALSLFASFKVFAVGEHWTWNHNSYPFNATFVAVINIDGEEQRSDQLEIGAFCGETCRGSIICEYEERMDRYFVYLTVNGEDGMLMNFRLWDHGVNSELDVTCIATYTFHGNDLLGKPSAPYIFSFTTNPAEFVFNGSVNELWSVAGNWESDALPTENDIAIINAPCQLDQNAEVFQLVVNDNQTLTVTDGKTLTASQITSDAATKLVVADGGQLVCDDMEGVYATVQKSVEGYGEGSGKWCFIASPLVDGTSHEVVGNLVNEAGYDLYSFDQAASDGLEWRNFKNNDLTLNPGEGYLYANTTDVVLEFAGELNSTVNDVLLDYVASCHLAGWNLIGNPFVFAAYADRSYYVLDDDGVALNPIPASQAVLVHPCTGIMVKASTEGETVAFGKSAPRENNGCLSLSVSKGDRDKSADRAVVSFQSGDALAKCVFSNNNPKLWIPQDGSEYAVVSSEKEGEVPVNFKAVANGIHTLCVVAKDVDMEYLRLIDNLTGVEVNLLETPNYTFESNAGDCPSRFRLLFKVNDKATYSSSPSAL